VLLHIASRLAEIASLNSLIRAVFAHISKLLAFIILYSLSAGYRVYMRQLTILTAERAVLTAVTKLVISAARSILIRRRILLNLVAYFAAGLAASNREVRYKELASL
jgi:hypothetical protein